MLSLLLSLRRNISIGQWRNETKASHGGDEGHLITHNFQFFNFLDFKYHSKKFTNCIPKLFSCSADKTMLVVPLSRHCDYIFLLGPQSHSETLVTKIRFS